ncbi:MAG: flippase-like domain-containing protein [bacterium]|nr:flippase-like domain-containing protein [bacterium]
MKYLKLIIILGLVGVLLYFFLNNVDFEEVINIIKEVNPLYPLLFLFGTYGQYYLRAYRWGIILRPHKQKISLMTLYNYTVIGFLLNTLIPGRVGEPARGILLAKEEGIDKSLGLASVVVERLIDSLMVVLLFLSSLLFLDSTTSPFMAKLKTASYYILPVMIFIFLTFYLINTPKVFSIVEKIIRFFSKLLPLKIREKVVAFLLEFVRGLRLDLSTKDYLRLALSSALIWVYLIPFYWILMQGFAFGSGIGILEAVPYFSVIVVSAAIPTPGMAGSFDAASRHGLENLYGVGTNPAAAYTLLVHFLIILILLIPGLVALWSKGLNLKTLRNLNAKDNPPAEDNPPGKNKSTLTGNGKEI